MHWGQGNASNVGLPKLKGLRFSWCRLLRHWPPCSTVVHERALSPLSSHSLTSGYFPFGVQTTFTTPLFHFQSGPIHEPSPPSIVRGVFPHLRKMTISGFVRGAVKHSNASKAFDRNIGKLFIPHSILPKRAQRHCSLASSRFYVLHYKINLAGLRRRCRYGYAKRGVLHGERLLIFAQLRL